MIGAVIIAKLLTSLPLRNLVGVRIRPNVIKVKDQTPAIYVLDYQMEKLNCDADSGVWNGIVEIGIHSKDYNLATKAMREIRSILDNFSGVEDNFGVPVGITILNGQETADDYDEISEAHIKVIEYEAYAQEKT